MCADWDRLPLFGAAGAAGAGLPWSAAREPAGAPPAVPVRGVDGRPNPPLFAGQARPPRSASDSPDTIPGRDPGEDWPSLPLFDSVSQPAWRSLSSVLGVLERERRQHETTESLCGVGSWRWTWERTERGEVEWSREMCRLHGLVHPPRPLTVASYLELVHPDDRPRVGRLLEGILSVARPFETGLRLVHADGTMVEVEARAILAADGSLEGTVQDVTDRRRAERRLRYVADHDALTGLLNRRGFIAELERHATRIARYGPDGGILMLDVDELKRVNDTRGHAAGDELLAAVTRCLAGRVRLSDVVARIGGDEFAILIPRGGDTELAALAEGLLAGLRAMPEGSSGRRRGVSASIGGATFTTNSTAEDVLARADAAMYEAKERGRGRYVAYVLAVSEAIRMEARIRGAAQIERALEAGDFELWAQPVVCVASGQVAQLELLLRLRADDGRLVAPAEFLPVAERFDLVQDVDRWVLRAAAAALGRCAKGVALGVNLSMRSLGDEVVLDELAAALVGAPHGSIIFDVAESAVAADIGSVRRFGDRVRGLGAGLALDDFGSGFGSFYWLRHLPCDYLKIDGAFVRGACDDVADRAIVAAVIDLAHELGKRTVAEGVDDPRVMDILREEGVDFAQGFHLGRPEPLEQLLAAP